MGFCVTMGNAIFTRQINASEIQGNAPGVVRIFGICTPKPLPLVENTGVCYLLKSTSFSGLNRFDPIS